MIEDFGDRDCVGDSAASSLLTANGGPGAPACKLHHIDPHRAAPHHRPPGSGDALECLGVSLSALDLRVGVRVAWRPPWNAWLLDRADGCSSRLTESPTGVAADGLVAPERGADPVHRLPPSVGRSGVGRPRDPRRPRGPSRRPMWIPLVQDLAAQGFAVVQPNVRGSFDSLSRCDHCRRRATAARHRARHRGAAPSPRDSQPGRGRPTRCPHGGSGPGRLHGALVPRLMPEPWAGRVAKARLELRDVPPQHVGLQYRRAFREREYGARWNAISSSSSMRRRSRTSTGSGRRSSSSTVRTIPGCR